MEIMYRCCDKVSSTDECHVFRLKLDTAACSQLIMRCKGIVRPGPRFERVVIENSKGESFEIDGDVAYTREQLLSQNPPMCMPEVYDDHIFVMHIPLLCSSDIILVRDTVYTITIHGVKYDEVSLSAKIIEKSSHPKN